MKSASLLFAALLVSGACAPPDNQGDDDAPGADGGPIDRPDAGGTTFPPDAAVPADCSQTFRLEGHASASTVWLTGDFVSWAGTPGDGAIEMALGGDGAWTVEHTLEPGSYLYKFVVDGSTWLQDPANPDSEDDGFGGRNSVYRCGEIATACGNPTEFDWRDQVMYFVMIDRFYDSDGMSNPVAGATDGDARFGPSGQYEGGDLQGVRDQLGYLDDLGVTAIWLSAPFDNRDAAGAAIDPSSDSHTYSGYHGYWPSPDNVSYASPDAPSPTPLVEPRIGTAEDLHGVVDDAHGRGMKVMFDYVMNHVDRDSGLYASHPEWFVYGDGCGPGNPCFTTCGGSNNLWDDPYWGTRCAFTDYLPPFDMYNDAARAWSVRDAIWWAKEFGIDGYRLDAIKHVPLSWLQDLRAALNDEVPGPGDRFYLVGETFDYFDRDKLKYFIDPRTMLDGQFDFPFKRALCEAVFRPDGNLGSFAGFMGGNDGYYNATAEDRAIMTTWIGNHDIPRAIHFASGQIDNCTQGSWPGNGWNAGAHQQPSDAAPYERLGVAFAAMMLNPGIPLIYYGDEIGLAGGGDPDNRRMMPWDDTTLNDHQKALRARVAKLAAIRAQYPVIGRGARTNLSSGNDTWVYKMGDCGEGFPEVIVAINKSDAARTVSIPSGSWRELMGESDFDGGDYSLPARSFVVLAPR